MPPGSETKRIGHGVERIASGETECEPDEVFKHAARVRRFERLPSSITNHASTQEPDLEEEPGTARTDLHVRKQRRALHLRPQPGRLLRRTCSQHRRKQTPNDHNSAWAPTNATSRDLQNRVDTKHQETHPCAQRAPAAPRPCPPSSPLAPACAARTAAGPCCTQRKQKVQVSPRSQRAALGSRGKRKRRWIEKGAYARETRPGSSWSQPSPSTAAHVQTAMRIQPEAG